MELKPYQQTVIEDIDRYLRLVVQTKSNRRAFETFWMEHPRHNITFQKGGYVEPYKEHINGVPHITIKVPTAGGKTFIACNAIRTIFNHFQPGKPQAVVWLVPSVTILEQTIKNLRDPYHPYRQKINSHFNSRVEVFDKKMLLNGIGFNSSSVQEQLTIVVLSFDSLRAKNKEDRKVHQENGQLLSFQNFVGEDNEVSVGEVLKNLEPVVIVDESHNAETELSIEMLNNLNPSFVLDLTATPRRNSNILSFVDAIELKKENMVKLPVIAYNLFEKTDVINTALALQKKLEQKAKEEEKVTGTFIRPIVLFQAQPKAKDDTVTFTRLKEKLIQAGIPKEHIRIKTAQINEIEKEDLMSKDCQVRYIITINALKEGWDCPFAYILATIADKSSAVDVEQILGRVLRQPFVKKHQHFELNMSYVLFCSSKFERTLDSIVSGLNRSGFSKRDYRGYDYSLQTPTETKEQFSIGIETTAQQIEKIPEFSKEDVTEDIITENIVYHTEEELPNHYVENLFKIGKDTNEEMEETVLNTPLFSSTPVEIANQMNTYPMRKEFVEIAKEITLPQFAIEVPTNPDIFNYEAQQLLHKNILLEKFMLSKSDTNINFDEVESQMHILDIDTTTNDIQSSVLKNNNIVREKLLTYIVDPSKESQKLNTMVNMICNKLGALPPIPEAQVRGFVSNVLENFTNEQFSDLINNELRYIEIIRKAINERSNAEAKRKFKSMLDVDKISLLYSYKLPPTISPTDVVKQSLPKSLYESEIRMNDFELSVARELGSWDNIAFWTKNIENKGFFINGPTGNHYPDFIAYTKSNKVLLIETKGDHLIATDKIELGKHWNSITNNKYKYMLVYQDVKFNDAYTFEELKRFGKDF